MYGSCVCLSEVWARSERQRIEAWDSVIEKTQKAGERRFSRIGRSVWRLGCVFQRSRVEARDRGQRAEV